MSTRTGQEREFTGRHMLLVLIGFFGTVIAVNVLMAWYATHTWSGLVVPNSYVASQHYNEVLAAAEAQAARGWTSTLNVRGGNAVFELKDRHANPVGGYEVSAKFERPVEEHEDMVLTLKDNAGDGRYVARAPLKTGQWEVIVDAHGGQETYRQVFHLIVETEN